MLGTLHFSNTELPESAGFKKFENYQCAGETKTSLEAAIDSAEIELAIALVIAFYKDGLTPSDFHTLPDNISGPFKHLYWRPAAANKLAVVNKLAANELTINVAQIDDKLHFTNEYATRIFNMDYREECTAHYYSNTSQDERVVVFKTVEPSLMAEPSKMIEYFYIRFEQPGDGPNYIKLEQKSGTITVSAGIYGAPRKGLYECVYTPDGPDQYREKLHKHVGIKLTKANMADYLKESGVPIAKQCDFTDPAMVHTYIDAVATEAAEKTKQYVSISSHIGNWGF